MIKRTVLFSLLAAVLLSQVCSAAQIFRCKVAELRPTQLAVGMEQVAEKAHKIRKMSWSELDRYEREKPEPGVLGPGGAFYIIDHHHLARALSDLNIDATYCAQLADYTRLSRDDFWKKMEEQKWVYPYDEYGRRRSYAEIPSGVRGLRDDPYRSLAGAVRDAGGYEKTSQPFAEFQWADFFRSRFSRQELTDKFGKCVEKAVKLARSGEAAGLPGYLGKK